MSDIASLITQLEEADTAKVEAARRELNALADRAKEAERRALADALCAALTARTATRRPVHPKQVRVWLCEHLAYLAAPHQLPVLLRAFRADREIREAVCRVLGVCPCDAGADALASEIKKEPDPALRIAMLNALVAQPRRKAVSVARAVAREDADLEVRLHALDVLASFPVADSDSVYADALARTAGKRHPRIHRARTRLCEALAQDGQHVAARTVARRILASDAPAPQKKAAQRLIL